MFVQKMKLGERKKKQRKKKINSWNEIIFKRKGNIFKSNVHFMQIVSDFP